MTRRKAIEILKQRECCRECVVDNGDCNECEKAFEMAIKALEHMPCEDAVSRRAVEKITWEEPSYRDALNVLTEVRDKVRALPSVTLTSKEG